MDHMTLAFYAVLIAALLVLGAKLRQLYGLVIEKLGSLAKSTAELRKKTEAQEEEALRLRSWVAELEDMAKAAQEQTEGLRRAVEEAGARLDAIPTEQLQSIYDSEKQFQDGLSAILSYGQEHFGLNKDGATHE